MLELLARQFKVSTLVVLRRLYDAYRMNRDEHQTLFAAEMRRILGIIGNRAVLPEGNFFATEPTRVSRRFVRAVVTSTLKGQTPLPGCLPTAQLQETIDVQRTINPSTAAVSVVFSASQR